MEVGGSENLSLSSVSTGDGLTVASGAPVVQGDMVTGDKFTGDKVTGDKVYGDKITNIQEAPKTKPTLVLSHGEYCASLTGFRRYLRPEVLPFIAPEEGANTQPEAILSRLETLAGSGGVLLKGVGGVGKTRTALEVGHRAEAKGWRCLLYTSPSPRDRG